MVLPALTWNLFKISRNRISLQACYRSSKNFYEMCVISNVSSNCWCEIFKQWILNDMFRTVPVLCVCRPSDVKLGNMLLRFIYNFDWCYGILIVARQNFGNDSVIWCSTTRFGKSTPSQHLLLQAWQRKNTSPRVGVFAIRHSLAGTLTRFLLHFWHLARRISALRLLYLLQQQFLYVVG